MNKPLYLGLLLVMAVGGCADNSGRAAVHGLVKLDDKPLASGSISFYPVQGAVAGSDIVDGKYSIPADKGAVVGTNRVQISAYGPTGRMYREPSGEMSEERAQLVPASYNTQTTLQCEVEPGKNKCDFDLKTN